MAYVNQSLPHDAFSIRGRVIRNLGRSFWNQRQKLRRDNPIQHFSDTNFLAVLSVKLQHNPQVNRKFYLALFRSLAFL
jgi:hypothetical protein